MQPGQDDLLGPVERPVVHAPQIINGYRVTKVTRVDGSWFHVVVPKNGISEGARWKYPWIWEGDLPEGQPYNRIMTFRELKALGLHPMHQEGQ